MISKQALGRTGHTSTRIIFGSYALSQATQAEADRVLDLLLEHGVNHIDTGAAYYGNAEKRIGPWLDKHRADFFIATKTRQRTYQGAWKNLQRSLDRLRVDHIDLWQMHALTSPAGWERAMGPGGTLEAFVKARDQGVVRFLADSFLITAGDMQVLPKILDAAERVAVRPSAAEMAAHAAELDIQPIFR